MVAKISISIPQDLLAKVEAERAATGQSRSEFFVQVVETFLKEKQEQELDAAYIKAYQECPETEEELAWTEIGLSVFADNPWKEEKKHG
jgi:metal-responsive CopG/Arc/MetJ family transcriptional regulator